MRLRDVFFNQFGRLRSGWRLGLYILLCILISIFMEVGLRVVYAVGRNYVPPFRYAGYAADFAYRVTFLATGLGAGYLCARFLEGLPWRSLGLTLHQRWVRDLVVGSVVGIAGLALAVVMAMSNGGLRFSLVRSEMVAASVRSLITSSALLFVAALAEEAAFRGYPLQTFARARLAVFGVLVTSVPFGLIHLGNPNVSIVALVNTILAGVWLGVAYLKTRSLWFPLGVHWGWNFALGWIFGLPVSGVRLVSSSLLTGDDVGPAWLTGGNYGIEGGVAGTLAMIAFTFVTWFIPVVSPTPELLKLTSEENPALPSRVSA